MLHSKTLLCPFWRLWNVDLCAMVGFGAPVVRHLNIKWKNYEAGCWWIPFTLHGKLKNKRKLRIEYGWTTRTSAISFALLGFWPPNRWFGHPLLLVRRCICKVVHPVVKCFPEAIIDWTDYGQICTLMASALFVNANRQHTAFSKVRWSTPMDLYLTCKSIFYLMLRWRAGIDLLYSILSAGWRSVHLFVSLQVMSKFRETFQQ